MKKNLLIFILSSLSWCSYSEYPLGFSFDEIGLFPESIHIYKQENAKVTTILLRNANDEFVTISSNIVELPACKVSYIYDFEKILLNNPVCQRTIGLFGRLVSKYKLNSIFEIMFFEKNVAVIFKNQKFLATMASNIPGDKFMKLIDGIKEYSQKYKTGKYLEMYKIAINKGHYHKALKYLICALLVDLDNNNIIQEYHQLNKIRMDEIRHIDSDFIHEYKIP